MGKFAIFSGLILRAGRQSESGPMSVSLAWIPAAEMNILIKFINYL